METNPHKSVDAVIIATPNNLHAPIALACLKAGKHVMLEKPLGISAQEAMELAAEAKKSGLVHMTALTYRFAPAIRFMKQLVDQGKLGSIRHFRSQRFLDWPETAWGWRQYKSTAGAGNIYDMSIHRIDFAQYLLGPITSVSGKVKQFVPRTKQPNGESCPPSEVDDWTALLVDFECGATGVFEGSTLMKGHHNNGFGYEWAEINGSEATAVYQLQDPFHVQFGKQGESLQKLPVPPELLVVKGSPRDPTAGVPSTVFRYDQLWEFISAIVEKREASPSFFDGASAQVVADCAILSSTKRTWIDVPKFTAHSVAIVTGGGTGIGRGIALRFAQAGAKVYILGRRKEVLDEVAKHSSRLVPVECDVAERPSVMAAFEKVLTDSKRIDILVNSAGNNIPKRAIDLLSAEDYRSVMSINLDGTFFCIQAALPTMRAQNGGVIINISSVAGLRGLPLAGAAYCASKAAVNALSSIISAEQYQHNIRVTNICPGEVNTPLIDKRSIPEPPEKRALMLQSEDLAEVALTVALLPPRAQVSEVVIKPTNQQFWL